MPKKKLCEKTAYATHAEARAAISAMAEKFPSIVFKKAYRCAKCKAWHITSSPPPRGRRIQR